MRFLILMYHAVAEPSGPAEKKLACSPRNFKKQMEHLKKHDYSMISLEKAVSALKHKQDLPARSVVITFDDGYIDTYEYAYPVLRGYGFPATIFTVSDLVGKSNEWMQRDGGISRKLCTWRQLKEMAENGMAIGSHTSTHVKLDKISPISAYGELVDSKKQIEAKLGVQVQFFAYPYGRYHEQNRRQVQQAGYMAACTTNSGFNTPSEDVFLLRRIDIFGTDRLWQFKSKLEFGVNWMPFSFIVKYYQSRILAHIKIKE